MDVETLCIVCNWVNDAFWPWGPFGAFGGAAAGAAASGLFGGGGSFGGGSGQGEPSRDSVDQDDAGADQTQSQSDYDDSVIKPPGRGESWPETGRNTRDAFRQQRQEFGRTNLERAADEALDWFDHTFGIDRTNTFVVSGTSRNPSSPN